MIVARVAFQGKDNEKGELGERRGCHWIVIITGVAGVLADRQLT